MLKAHICWWKNILVFMEEYFGFWSNKTIAISYPVNLNQDLTKRKHKTINLRTINVPLKRNADSQYRLMFKKKARDY